MNVDGTNIQPLSDTSEAVDYASISPDGKHIAFITGYPRSPAYRVDSLMVMDRDGGNKRLLTKTPAAYPSWSPNSQSVAFAVVLHSPGSSYYGIFTIGLDGSGEKRVSNILGSYHLSGWFRDYRLLGGVAQDTLDGTKYVNGCYIFLMDTMGNITSRWGGGGAASWSGMGSHDGKHIAFISTKSGTRCVYLLNVENNRDSLILRDQNDFFKEPVAFSPDDTQLLYNAGGSGLGKMRIVDLRTGAVKDITPFKDDTTTCLAVSWGRN